MALQHPLRTVGAVLDQWFPPQPHGPGSPAHHRDASRSSALTVDEVLDLVDLTAAARRRVGGFSLGMRQRLALASALIGRTAAELGVALLDMRAQDDDLEAIFVNLIHHAGSLS